MDVRITARHCSITDSTREFAETRVSRLTRFEPRVRAAEVLISDDAGSRHAEVKVAVPGASLMQAHGEADSFRAALDRAVDRIERQLRRRHGRRRTHRATRTSEALSAQ
jgi:putative sigma-54 modulation protein